MLILFDQLTLGSNFGSKPTISVGSADYINDLSSSIVLSLTATQFSSILSNNTNTSDGTVSLTDPSNLLVIEDTSVEPVSLTPNLSDWYHFEVSQLQDSYDGTNRIGNLNTFDSARTTPGTSSSNFHWVSSTGSDIEFDILQALRLPLMGVAPHIGYTDKIVLADSGENLSAGLKTFTEGQASSFNEIKVSDNSVLVLDAATFKLLDTVQQTASWSSQNGLSIVNSSGVDVSIKVTGTYSEFIENGLYSATDGFATELSGNVGANLISQITEYSVYGTAATSADVTNISAFVNNAPTGKTVTSNLSVASSLTTSTSSTGDITAAQFTSIAELDSLLTSQNIFADNYSSGVSIVDTSDNIKSLLTSSSADIIAAKIT